MRGMARRFAPGWMALAVAASLVAGPSHAARRHPVRPANPANEKLLKLPPPERAAMLAKAVDHWCIGTEAFFMGVSTSGRGAGNAYWSLRCVDGSTWAVQIDPLTEVTAIDCASFKAAGGGKECFKKF
jgi:hypothetical protein